MVELRTLTPSVLVRIQLPQPRFWPAIWRVVLDCWWGVDEEKIVIIDPVIEEEPKKVEVKKQEESNNVKEDLFKEKYQNKFKFYRLKKNETLEDVIDKFNVSRNKLLNANKNKMWKENVLVQIPNDEQ